MKKVTSLILAFCILMTGVISVVYAEEAEVSVPKFSHEGGVYKESFMLTIDGGGNTVYYTLDGSMPNDKSAVYSEEISIESKMLSPRTVQGRVAQERWETGVVVRAISVDALGAVSPVVTNTYFISEKISEIAKNVPIVAISGNPYDFWDEKEGIYTNYNYEHNILGYVEYFDNNGEGFERSLELKVSGHGSRSNPKKSIRLYFTKGDTEGRKNLEYDLVEIADKNFYNTDKVKKHGKITFRISDWADTDLRDPVAQRIADYMRPDTAASTPAAIFINGEFWGVYEAREQYDNRYLDFHYEDIGKDDVVFLDRDWTTENEEYVLSDNGEKGIDRILYEEGPEEDESYYRDQFNYVKHLMINAKDEAVYRELSAYVDIDNLIDYLFVYMYTDNIDWPGNNMKFWRTTMERSNNDVYAADGKWRFMVHDFDLAFDGVNNNTMEYVLKSELPPTEPRHPGFAAEIFEGLFQNEEFRNKFAQRSAAYISTCVSKENMTEIADSMIKEREGVKGYDLMRWNNKSGTSKARLDSWRNSVTSKFVGFAEGRNPYFTKMISDFYKKYYESKIGEMVKFTFDIDTSIAAVDIDGAIMRESFYGEDAKSVTTNQFANIPLAISAECANGKAVKSVIIEHDGKTEVYEGAKAYITPVSGEYNVKFTFGDEGEKCDYESLFVLRENRFSLMSVGEKLPLEAIAVCGDGDSEKVFGFAVSSESACVEVGDNGIITALSAGEGEINVNYNGITAAVKVVVK